MAAEVGFIVYLCLKEAYAVAAGEHEHATTTTQAAEQFRVNHLEMLAAPLAAVLADSDLDSRGSLCSGSSHPSC